MTDETRERVLEWLTSVDTCYLVGAGCSRCAGKPLIGELTRNVLRKVHPSIKEQFDGLKVATATTRPPTVEDLLNYLVCYQMILETVSDPSKHHLQPVWIENALKSLKKEIVGQIADKWLESKTHGRLLQRLACFIHGAVDN